MKRIQRKRTKGWRMPEGTIYVGRGTKWGNPLRLMGDMIYIDAGYRRNVLDKWVLLDDLIHDINDLLEGYERLLTEVGGFHNPDLQYWLLYFRKLNLSELRGKNLACWCKENEPCHADILLKLANNLVQ